MDVSVSDDTKDFQDNFTKVITCKRRYLYFMILKTPQ